MSEQSELLEQYRTSPDSVEQAITGASEDELNYRPAPGKWSARQIVCHLADTEANAVVRFRQILSEDEPTFVPFQQDAWATNTDYDRRPLHRAIATLRMLRQDNYDLLRGIREDAWLRAGRHPVRGPMSVLDLLRLFTRHTDNHTRQIHELRQAFAATK